MPPGAATCAIPPAGGNLLRNPGFESGDTLWSATPNVINQGGGQPNHTGTWNAWLDGIGSDHTDSIAQSVTIPAGRPASLWYYVHIDTDEGATTSIYDTMTVRAGSTVLQTLSNVNAMNGYQLRTVDLSAYAGQTISLSFTGVEDVSAQTSFVLDDVALITPAPPSAPSSVQAIPGNTIAAVFWTAPASNGGSAITSYTVTASPGGRTAFTTGAIAATVTGLNNGTSYSFTVKTTNLVGTSPASIASAAVTVKAPLSLVGFTGRAPTRVLDTRIGTGAPKAKLGPGRTLTLTLPGLPAGVAPGTKSVALNVTATGPTAGSYLTVYPGGTRPTASNLNFVPGQTIANMVVVPLGAGNKVTFYNAAGSVNVVADLVGYYS